MRGHGDEVQDKKMFSKMLKKAMPMKKVASHLKSDVKEQKMGIRKDKSLMKSMKSHKRGGNPY